MRILIIIIAAAALCAPARAPSPIYRVRLAVLTSAPRSGLHAPVSQGECNQETARLNPLRYGYQETGIADPLGYPFGQVAAWNCDGDKIAAAQEFLARVAAMQAEAAAYRAAHPIAGVPR